MAEKSFREWSAKKHEDRYKYWRMLKRAKDDYLELTDDASAQFTFVDSDFYYYLEQNFGLKPEIIDGKIGSNYNVVDEKKYLLFVLKYTS